MNVSITNTTRVTLIHASTGGTEWAGTLREFFDANAETVDAAERDLIVKILGQGGVYYFGGGAGPLFHLKAALVADPPDIIAEQEMEASYYADAKRQGLDEISTERYVHARRAADGRLAAELDDPSIIPEGEGS